jgi:hypothetical protein
VERRLRLSFVLKKNFIFIRAQKRAYNLIAAAKRSAAYLASANTVSRVGVIFAKLLTSAKIMTARGHIGPGRGSIPRHDWTCLVPNVAKFKIPFFFGSCHTRNYISVLLSQKTNTI